MSHPNENPLTPASLATDGNQGAGAKADSPCGCEHTPCNACLHEMAALAVEVARRMLALVAAGTDYPEPGTVDAADLLDTAACYLHGEFCQALKGGRGGGA
ncbi:hypothetical protein [Marilutibacter spongiae]|uniref:DUF3077 domain-containing protein n=1 Tax=Marilutibacter spongiae TaxID=2025720 RepID=A0A7W3Y7D8_9GAMM|nr:hypothetical protein [Lysobacter spongiae]MBB1061861.1 hypothetical protein [Lysobacter spongiae]